MKILEMTAVFGKLQHETLTLRPGLNIIEAPNEWGKSTWCAFILAMFYGLDTRAKSTKTVIADKEHYAPWSGQPMSGRTRLEFQGRDITIERSTKGRVPMGQFSAYETETGLPVRELTADNCGEILLGAEQSVFRRSGFVRLSDLPVTRDDALMRRLNALVTTGDESGDGECLARELKNLKNKCRYHQNGLLPQTEQELSKVKSSLEELKNLQQQSAALSEKMQQEDLERNVLKNHLTHLSNQEASADAKRVREAEQQLQEAEKRLQNLQNCCMQLPARDQLQQKLSKLQTLSEKLDRLLEEERLLPRIDPPPAAPAAFSGMAPKEAVEMAREDQKRSEQLKLNFAVVWILAAVCCTAGAVLSFALSQIPLGIICIALAVGLFAAGFLHQKVNAEKLQSLTQKYGDENSDNWLLSAQYYLKAAESYQRDSDQNRNGRREFNEKLEAIKKHQAALCGEKTASETMEKLQQGIACWDSLARTEKEKTQTLKHLEALKTMAKRTQMPEAEDELFLSEEETLERIRDLEAQQQTQLGQIGQYQGRMEVLGTEDQLMAEELRLEDKIRKLEDYYEAINIALTKLEEAAAELRRRFAPRIVRRAQELMWSMTGGRYEKLTLEEDFSMKTWADDETVLHSVLFRSEGTMDQLYLSLRLAVAEALIPEAPLILDDALLRFDGKRLQKALEILQDEKEQVILFTCQDREGKIIPEAAVRKV